MTDAGLALVSQFVHRLSLADHTSNTTTSRTDSHNASDRFVSLFDLHNHPTFNTTSSGNTTVSEQNKVSIELLSLLPALLDWLEKSRTSLESIFQNDSTHKDSSVKPSATTESTAPVGGSNQPGFGSTVDRQDGKILVLMILALFELRVHRIVHDTVLLATLVTKVKVYELAQDLLQKSDAQHSFASFVPTATFSSTDTNSAGALSVNLCTLYNALEKRLLQQHDCTVMSAGLRCLQLLLNSVISNSPLAHDSPNSVLFQRVASMGWSCTRNVFSETTYLAAQLLPSQHNNSSTNNLHSHAPLCADIVVPGMDETWPLLVHTTSHQHALHVSLVELSTRVNRKTESVLSLFKTSFNTHADLHSAHMQPAEHTLLSCAAYRQFYCVWWAAETSRERVYGVALVLREIFKFMFASSGADNFTNGTSSAKKSGRKSVDKEEDSSDAEQYVPRSSRDKKNTKSSTATPTPTRNFAPEFLLMKDSKLEKTSNKFGISFLSQGTIEFHLAVMLPLLPALFLFAQPNADDMNKSDTTNATPAAGAKIAVTPTAEAGPYASFAHCSMLFMWFTQQLHTILDDEHTHLGIVLRTAPLLVKVCRAILVSVDAAIATAAAWRNAQPQIIDQTKYAGETRSRDSAPVDPGDMLYFEHLLQTALQVVQAVHTLGKTLQTIFITSGSFELPKALIAAVPALYNAAETHMSRVLHVAKLHAIAIDTSPSMSDNRGTQKKGKGDANPADQVGDKIMLQRMKAFLSRHDATVMNPLDPAALHAIIAASTNSSSNNNAHSTSKRDITTHHSITHNATTHNHIASDDDASDSEHSNGFDGFQAVTAAAQGGWGLYSHSTDDNNSEYSHNGSINGGSGARRAANNGTNGHNSGLNDYQSDNSSVYSAYSGFDNESQSDVLSEYGDENSEDEIEL